MKRLIYGGETVQEYMERNAGTIMNRSTPCYLCGQPKLDSLMYKTEKGFAHWSCYMNMKTDRLQQVTRAQG